MKCFNLSYVRFFVISSGLLFGGLASAQGPEFEKRKAEHLAEIDQRIQKMQEHRTCVANAANHEALQKCRETMREWHKEEHEKRDELRGKKPERKGQP